MDSFKKWIEQMKEFVKNSSKKKMMENLIIVIIVGIIIIIAGGTLFSPKSPKVQEPAGLQDSEAQTAGKVITTEDKAEVEKRVEEILTQISGAGKVSVMITYVSGKEIVPAYDTKKTQNDTQEKDSGGGTRNIKQDDYESKMVYEEVQGGGKKPIVLKEIQPAVKGVVVVADGASEATVREDISRAVQVLLDVPLHKVQVFARKK